MALLNPCNNTRMIQAEAGRGMWLDQNQNHGEIAWSTGDRIRRSRIPPSIPSVQVLYVSSIGGGRLLIWFRTNSELEKLEPPDELDLKLGAADRLLAAFLWLMDVAVEVVRMH